MIILKISLDMDRFKLTLYKCIQVKNILNMLTQRIRFTCILLLELSKNENKIMIKQPNLNDVLIAFFVY